MQTFRTLTRCPACGAAHSRATAVEYDKPPEPSDLTVCATCGAFAVFVDKDGRIALAALSPEKWAALPEETKAALFRARAGAARFRGGKKQN